MSSAAAIAKPLKPHLGGSKPRSILRDSLWMTAVGQVERAVGLLVTFALRWGLSAADLGIYSGLRLLLDNTSRSSLGVALGAIQKAPLLRAAGRHAEADRVLNVASTTNTWTSGIYGLALMLWGGWLANRGEPKWGLGLCLVGLLAILKRRQDFHIATLRSESQFGTVGRLAVIQSFLFAVLSLIGIYLSGFQGLMAALAGSFLVQGLLLTYYDKTRVFEYCWDLRLALNLALTGLPILAATSTWAMLNTLDRALILTQMPDGSAQAGFYSVAILATNWCGDIAGRVGLVLYPSYQARLGEGTEPKKLLVEAEKATLCLLGLMSALGLWAFLIGRWLLPVLFPQLAPGAAAFGPMLPGAIALAATWPMRQAWTALNRPWNLATLAGGVALTQWMTLQGMARSCTIAEIAWASSLFQGLALLLLISLGVMATSFDRERLKGFAIAFVVIAYCSGVAVFISNSAWDPAKSGEWLKLQSFMILILSAIPSIAGAAWYFATIKAKDTMNREEEAS